MRSSGNSHRYQGRMKVRSVKRRKAIPYSSREVKNKAVNKPEGSRKLVNQGKNLWGVKQKPKKLHHPTWKKKKESKLCIRESNRRLHQYRNLVGVSLRAHEKKREHRVNEKMGTKKETKQEFPVKQGKKVCPSRDRYQKPNMK